MSDKPAPKRDEIAVRSATDRLSSQLVESGWPRMPAVVFSCLLSSDADGLTSAELTESLSISAAAVSQAVRYLSDIGLVSRVHQPGSRRQLYRLRDSAWHEVVKRGIPTVARTRDAMRDSLALLGESTPAGRRMSEALAFYEFYETQLADILRRWDDLQRARG